MNLDKFFASEDSNTQPKETPSTTKIYVQKRDGSTEPLNLDKIHKVLQWSSNGLDVSVSEVEIKTQIQFFDGIKTSDIHKVLIKSAADLISKEYPDYQYMAARLTIFNLRKRVYNQFEPIEFFTHLHNMVEKGKYDKHIIEDYSAKEIREIGTYIDHERDFKLSYAGIKQLEGKYLVQNRTNGEIYETPQTAYILIGMALFSKEDKSKRLEYIKTFYDAVSLFKISLPTPIMAGVRTPTRQFSSCVVIESGDSLDSINAASSAIVKYISQRAGIGINAGRIRALGSEIRGGEAVHTGVIPFYKHFQTAVKSCSQGGIRSGAATLFYPIWHLEAESLLVLKNNKGVDENRVRHMDYGVQISKIFYERLIKGQNITLFSPNDVDDMYDAFFADQERFEKLYVQAENDPNIRKKTVKAIDLFSTLMQERASTGRIYIQNVDHCNTHSSFETEVAPIRQSNLCMEIALPTEPLTNIDGDEGEISLCTLAAFNLGEINSFDEFQPLANILVRALDALLDYQNYPVKVAKISTLKRRSLGVGIINYAYDLARRGYKYSDGSANNYTHNMMEAVQFWLLNASNELAKEKGMCTGFNETKYSKGILPIDTHKPDVDKLHSEYLEYDWESLRERILEHGLRNSTLTALMPSESSSQVSNATNGIEPPRGLVSVKASKDGILKQVVPEIEKYKDNYELLWDIPSNKGYLELVSIMQKFVDQAISANTNYDPSRWESGKVPMKQLIQDLLTAYKLGVKTLYYHNTRDGASDAQDDIASQSDDCETCKI